MFTLRNRSSRVAATTALGAGALLFVTGSLVGSPFIAAPSAHPHVAELRVDAEGRRPE